MFTRGDVTPCVLVIAGHDPSGGAGIQADIETLVSLGCYPATVVTALTVQNTASFTHCVATDIKLLQQQLDAVMSDFSIAACKIGLLPSAEHAVLIANTLRQLGTVPIVVDPVLGAGVGTQVADTATTAVLREQLIPLATVATPNVIETVELLPESADPAHAAARMHGLGWGYVLMTGTHASTEKVINKLFHGGDCVQQLEWERLPGEYHGSGCTLASAVAARLAHGEDVLSASEQAQQYTWNALKNALHIGHGQALPNRSLNI